MRPDTHGPLSETLTYTVDGPWVIRSMVPKGYVLLAQVYLLRSNLLPLAILLPCSRAPYHEAIPEVGPAMFNLDEAAADETSKHIVSSQRNITECSCSSQWFSLYPPQVLF